MTLSPQFARGLRLATALGLALSIAACANKPEDAAGANGLGGAGGYGAGGAGAATPGSPREFQVSVGDRVLFETDQSDLTPTAIATLDRQAAWMQRYPRYSVLIEGHADERGTREYNYSLGARRAQAVRDYLATKGVSRIRTVSYGKERPAAACAEPSCQSQNRRAVTVLEGGAGY